MAERDERPWIKLSLDYFDNPKIDALSDTAQLLHIQLILRSGRLKSDGKVSIRAAKSRGETAFKELVTGRLLNKITATTYQVHDYAKHQTASEKIATKAAAGARGGHTKNHARRFIYDDECQHCQDDAAGNLDWLKDAKLTQKTAEK